MALSGTVRLRGSARAGCALSPARRQWLARYSGSPANCVERTAIGGLCKRGRSMTPVHVKPGLFRDRREAGRLLAEKLAAYANQPDLLVLALPRGGVPVASDAERRRRG